jgi:hypothetical protein
VISNVEKVNRSSFSRYDMGKIQYHKLALWFPHIKLVSCAFWYICDCEYMDDSISISHPALVIILGGGVVVGELCI